jgi:Fe-S-cluster containining protein
MKPSTLQFEQANDKLAAACMACASSCCKKGLLFLLPEEKEQMEKWVKLNRPDWSERFAKNLRQEEGFYLFDQEDSCMFLDEKNLCLLHNDGVKPQECFVWPLHVYVGSMGAPEIRVSTTCCEGYKFVTKDSPSVKACEDYAVRIGHDRLSRFRELYGGSYGNTLLKELALSPKVRPLGPHELHLYRAAGEAFFPDEDWDRGMQRISRMHACHEDGLLVYEADDGRILGYATLWPLSDRPPYTPAPALFRPGPLKSNFLAASQTPLHPRSRVIPARPPQKQFPSSRTAPPHRATHAFRDTRP